MSRSNRTTQGSPKPTVRVFTPTKDGSNTSIASEVESKVEGMVSPNVSVSSVDGGFVTTADSAGRGPVEFPHKILDVTETFIKNTTGITDKSTLTASNPGGKTLQSCFVIPQGGYGADELGEINKLASFVTGLDVKAEQAGQKLYIDSGVTEFNHIALDVMEIVASRVSFNNGIDIQGNSMLIREPNNSTTPETTSDLPLGEIATLSAGAIGAIGVVSGLE
jgi:hypothetical protein